MQPILKGGFIMVNTKEMTESLIKELAFSEEELRELKAAKEKPIVFDEDCPELSPALMEVFKSAVVRRNRHKNA